MAQRQLHHPFNTRSSKLDFIPFRTRSSKHTPTPVNHNLGINTRNTGYTRHSPPQLKTPLSQPLPTQFTPPSTPMASSITTNPTSTYSPYCLQNPPTTGSPSQYYPSYFLYPPTTYSPSYFCPNCLHSSAPRPSLYPVTPISTNHYNAKEYPPLCTSSPPLSATSTLEDYDKQYPTLITPSISTSTETVSYIKAVTTQITKHTSEEQLFNDLWFRFKTTCHTTYGPLPTASNKINSTNTSTSPHTNAESISYYDRTASVSPSPSFSISTTLSSNSSESPTFSLSNQFNISPTPLTYDAEYHITKEKQDISMSALILSTHFDTIPEPASNPQTTQSWSLTPSNTDLTITNTHLNQSPQPPITNDTELLIPSESSEKLDIFHSHLNKNHKENKNDAQLNDIPDISHTDITNKSTPLSNNNTETNQSLPLSSTINTHTTSPLLNAFLRNIKFYLSYVDNDPLIYDNPIGHFYSSDLTHQHIKDELSVFKDTASLKICTGTRSKATN